MCGICGIFSADAIATRPEFGTSIEKMADLMARRGPDDQAYWRDPEGFLSLGFRRLAVLDLSRAGRQPMVSADGRSILVFNGEIYNFVELRQSLLAAGIRFRSTSDSEVLLEALNLWGLAALDRLNGMFAFGWYRPALRSLILVRDHAGIKPLYYFPLPSGKGLVFASQLDALQHSPWGKPGAIRPDALKLFLRLHHLPAPYTPWQHAYQLEPGHLLEIGMDGADARLTIRKRAWWTLARESEPDLRGQRAVDELGAALDGAVRRQGVADVPLGVFLSGGIDSPLITAFARRQSDPDLKAFTIGSPGWRQDESQAARAYAAHFQVDHHLEGMDGTRALDLVESIQAAQREPFADFSILPAMLVSQLARREVKVALSGDGGDELFFGYMRPRSLLRNGRDFRWPRGLRFALYAAGKLGLGQERSDVILAPSPGDYYFEVNSRFKEADLKGIAPELTALPADFELYQFGPYRDDRHLAQEARWIEFYGQLQRGLKKMDLAAMHLGLEVRVPLLDLEVIQIAMRIDPLENLGREKAGDEGTKLVLRRLLARFAPPALFPQAKLGFAVPLAEWLRGPLRPLVEDTLFSGPLFPEGLFERENLRRYWQDHLHGRRDLKWGLWSLLTLQWWFARHVNA